MSHAALAALLGGGQDPQDQSETDSKDPVQALQQAIQDVHELMALMPDAKHTQQIGQCLNGLLAVQSELSQAKQGQNPRQQILQQLGQ